MADEIEKVSNEAIIIEHLFVTIHYDSEVLFLMQTKG